MDLKPASGHAGHWDSLTVNAAAAASSTVKSWAGMPPDCVVLHSWEKGARNRFRTAGKPVATLTKQLLHSTKPAAGLAEVSGSASWMPRACPAEAHVSSYTRRLHIPLLPASPAAASPPRARRRARTACVAKNRTIRRASRRDLCVTARSRPGTFPRCGLFARPMLKRGSYFVSVATPVQPPQGLETQLDKPRGHIWRFWMAQDNGHAALARDRHGKTPHVRPSPSAQRSSTASDRSKSRSRRKANGRRFWKGRELDVLSLGPFGTRDSAEGPAADPGLHQRWRRHPERTWHSGIRCLPFGKLTRQLPLLCPQCPQPPANGNLQTNFDTNSRSRGACHPPQDGRARSVPQRTGCRRK